MFIVECKVQGKEETKTFQTGDGVIGFYLQMCKAQMESVGFTFSIDNIVKYGSGKLITFQLEFRNTGIYLVRSSEASEE